jgi:hypothetical protein
MPSHTTAGPSFNSILGAPQECHLPHLIPAGELARHALIASKESPSVMACRYHSYCFPAHIILLLTQFLSHAHGVSLE